MCIHLLMQSRRTIDAITPLPLVPTPQNTYYFIATLCLDYVECIYIIMVRSKITKH